MSFLKLQRGPRPREAVPGLTRCAIRAPTLTTSNPPCLASLTNVRAGIQPTRLWRALEKVEVAHMRSYQATKSIRKVVGASALTSPNAHRTTPHSRKSASRATALYKPSSSSSSLDTEGYPSMDYVLTADDTAGPPATRNNGTVVARSLGGSLALAEEFYFRSHENNMEAQALATALDKDGDDDNAADDENDGGATNSSSGARRFSRLTSQPSKQEYYYCALCREEIDPAVMSPRLHILSDSRASHTNHNCREVVLDSLALLGTRGYPVDHIVAVWAATLYAHDMFPRIQAWVQPWWPLEKRAARLFELLQALKNANVIDLSLAAVAPEQSGNDAHHHRRRLAFERMEYIGDNAWGTQVSSRMMLLFPDQQWQYSERVYGFNCFRDAVEMNVTNEILFDSLRLERLFPVTSQERLGSGKLKADIVEALIGELHCALWSYAPKIYDDVAYVEVNGVREDQLVAILEHCLTELYDLVMLYYCRELSWNAIPLAKELAARLNWLPVRPPVRPQKAFGRRHVPPSAATAATAVMVSPAVALVSSTSPSSRLDLVADGEGHKQDFVVADTGVNATAEGSGGGGGGSGASDPQANSAAGDRQGQALMPPSGNVSATPSPLANLSIMSLANLRMLPATPRLFDVATPYPSHVPNPLRCLPQESIPENTRSAYTGQDVFTGLIASYKQLNLLSDDAFQVYDIQDAATNPPQWYEMITQLVPSLSLTDEAAASTTAAPSPAPPLDLMENVYYTDPYYNLFPTPRTRAALDHETSAAAPTQPPRQPRMWGQLRLPEVTSRVPFPTRKEWLAFLAESTYPKLQSTPLNADDDDGASGAASSAAAAAHMADSFAPSRWVPAGVRPPSAGVITDKNLFQGTFAFLAHDTPDAVSVFLAKREAVAATEDGEKRHEALSRDAAHAKALKEAVAYWTEIAEQRRGSAEAATLFVDSLTTRFPSKDNSGAPMAAMTP